MLKNIDIDSIEEDTIQRFSDLKKKHELSIRRKIIRDIASDGIKKLKLVFGPLIKWMLLVYNISIKKKEVEKLERCLTVIEYKRNSLIQSLEEKQSSLQRVSEKIDTISKRCADLSQALQIVNSAL